MNSENDLNLHSMTKLLASKMGHEKEEKIYLFFNINHYDVITSMPAFFARKMYFHTGKKLYEHIGDHLCPDLCKLCKLCSKLFD